MACMQDGNDGVPEAVAEPVDPTVEWKEEAAEPEMVEMVTLEDLQSH